MKELFIKCPSCGVVLGVKNSKNETVKKITCPQCKHRLAVSFEEEIRPQQTPAQPLGALYYGEMRIPLQEGTNNTQFPGSQCIALNVVRLADGGSKCIVQPLVANGSVKINGEVLQKGDEVVLAKGDKLEIGHVVLYYDKPYSLPMDEPKFESTVVTKPEPKPQPQPQLNETPRVPEPPRNNNWLYLLVCLVAFALVIFLLWPKQKRASQPKSAPDTTIVAKPDSKAKQKDAKGDVKIDQKKSNSSETEKKSETPKKELSQYDLEQAALHGDAEAQLKLGRQLVKRRESNQVILGLNYLHQAARKGNGEAGRVWTQTVQVLQRKAAANDSAAYYILMMIDQ